MTEKLPVQGGSMTNSVLYRLADHTVVEPLIDHWIAWPHNFSPVLYALHLLNYQKEVLASYLKNPSFHVKSSRNPKLLGGPFVDIPEQNISQVQQLLATIEQNHGDLLTLGRDLTEFQNMLMKNADGQSIERYYEQLPESLRGFVELGYDYHNNPVVRCIESLFYQSGYYKKQSQSLRFSALQHDDARSYYMSTPRLANDEDIEWVVPFESVALDRLFQLDVRPQSLSDICELLALAPQLKERLLPLLTSDPPAYTKSWQGSKPRIRYFGHACVLIEVNGVSILTDPFVSVSPKHMEVERYTFSDLPEKIDYVLITHGHHDHFVFETLLRLRHRVGTLVVPKNSGIFYGDLSLKQLGSRLGFKQVQEMDSLDNLMFEGGKITTIPFLGEHCDLLHAKTAYIISFGSEQILFAADSCCLDQRIYENIIKFMGPIQTVFIGMECIGAPLSWVYSPLLPIKPDRHHDQARRSHANDAQSAFSLLQAVQAQNAYVYALGREPWLKYFMALTPSDDDPYMQEVNQLIAAVKAKGFKEAEMLYGQKEFFLV